MSKSLIRQGLALERKIHKREAHVRSVARKLNQERWEFADWLAGNTYVQWSRSDEVIALQPVVRAHMIPLTEYAKTSTYSRQYLHIQRLAALIAPPHLRTDDTALDVVTKLWNLYGEVDKVRSEIGRKTLVRSYKPEYQSYMDVVENLEKTESTLRGALRRIDDLETVGMSEEALERIGISLTRLSDLVAEIHEHFGMDVPTTIKEQ